MTLRTAAILATTFVLATAPAAVGDPDASAPRARKHHVTVAVPDQLVEGDRFTVEVKVRRTTGAQRLLLQQLVTDIYGGRGWVTVSKAKVGGKTRHSFRAVAGKDDAQKYRARVLYAGSKPAVSKPVTTTVWHWTSMMEFTAYDYSHGISSNAYNQFAMNGTEYHGGWFTTGTYLSWDLRFTPGRHCKAFRGVAGLTDASADGASGALQLVADETSTVYASPTLTPGMTTPISVTLAVPYRLFIQAQRTSPAERAAYPAIGNPELLCTGLE